MATAAIKPRAKGACRLCRGGAVKTEGQWLKAKKKKQVVIPKERSDCGNLPHTRKRGDCHELNSSRNDELKKEK